MTGDYGTGWWRNRKAEAIAKIDYGFDVVALLDQHRAARKEQ